MPKAVPIANPSLAAAVGTYQGVRGRGQLANIVRDAAFAARLPGTGPIPRVDGAAIICDVPSWAKPEDVARLETQLAEKLLPQ